MLPANFDLQGFLRIELQTHPLKTEALDMAAEGRDGYDCKGFTVLMARDLYRFGADLQDMSALAIETDRPVKHMVLVYRSAVLDNSSGWIGRPSDYRVIGKISWIQLLEMGQAMGIAFPPPNARTFPFAPPLKKPWWVDLFGFLGFRGAP